MSSDQDVLDEAIAKARIWLGTADDWERVLRRLRLEGYSINLAVRVTQAVLGMSRHDAHTRVLASDVWEDQRDVQIAAQDALMDYLDEHGNEGTLEVEL